MIHLTKTLLRRAQAKLRDMDRGYVRLRTELAKARDSRHDPPDEFAVTAALRTPLTGRVYADFSEVEKSIYRESISVSSPEAVVALIRAVGYVIDHGIPGSFVECGVFEGGNIQVMIQALQNLRAEERDIYLYDTFAGMPQPGARDDEGFTGEPLRMTWEANRTNIDGTSGSKWMRADLDTVRRNVRPFGYPKHRLHFVKGLVEETIPGVMPDQIAILRLDTDFYSSTKHELEQLYPRLSSRGILIVDDYGSIPGARKAVDEYAAEHRTGWFLNRVDAHVRLIIKP